MNLSEITKLSPELRGTALKGALLLGTTQPHVEAPPLSEPVLTPDIEDEKASLTIQKDEDRPSERVMAGPSVEKSLGPWVHEDLRAVPIQIWEGVVVDVDKQTKSMSVTLTAKIGSVPRHSADIALEWVHPQDLELVRPGAVFYWSLFKETKRGAIHNSEALRFRRRPYWSAAQLSQIRLDAQELSKHIKKRAV